MINFAQKLLIIFTFLVSSCSSLDVLKQSYKNFSAPAVSKLYIVQPGDSIWSISINLNLDAELLIKNNNLKKPFTIFPNQELILSENFSKNNSIQESKSIVWHHPLGQESKEVIKDDTWLIFKERKGLPIYSIYSGKVVVSGPDIPGYGNLVMISHPNGFLSLYAHCSKIFVEQGDNVVKGAMIAQIGDTEASYPMLKFQLRNSGVPLNSKKLESLF